MKHQRQSRDEKMEALFPPNLTYLLNKIHESARGSDKWGYGACHVSKIREIIEKFKLALEKSEIAEGGPTIENQIEQLEYPLAELDKYFTEKGQGRLGKEDAQIFTTFVSREILELKKMAHEIDEESW